MNKKAGDESQPIEIFRTGHHRDMSGADISFSESDLAETAAAYDPSAHEAPLVIGHPKANAPAYGWVKELEFSENALTAIPHQVDPEFAEMVSAGRFKKVSASFYKPGASNNPTPEVFALRHVGFLGAQPPAVKGLKPVEFADDDDAITMTVDFAAPESETGWSLKRVYRILGSLREFLIEEYGSEKANKVIEKFDLETGAEEAAQIISAPQPDSARSFNEAPLSLTTTEKEPTMNPSPKTPVAVAAEPAQPDTAELDRREQTLKDREAKFAERERTAKANEVLDGLVKSGQVLPAEKKPLAQFMAKLDDQETVSFGEGDEKTQKAFLVDFLGSLPNRVDFSERSGGDIPAVENASATETARDAVAYQEEMRTKGVTVSTSDAVDHVMKGTDQ